MSVYVDDMFRLPIGRMGRMKMSHMIADSSDELLAMADKLGLSRTWLQYAGTPHEHFDVSLAYRKRAIELGAQEISWRELGRKVRQRSVASQEGIAP